ncbi:Cobalamin B12-binding [Raphidiopsis brookii D9]|nr:Cobalamin B12-binding [Raphidiopsis brookii D9]
MRVLLVYPIFPKTFWSYEKILDLVDRKVLLPPLGLITVAAILPQEWEFKLVDRNIRPATEEEWAWADVVIFSAMIVQKQDLLDQVREAKRRGKLVALGGPYPTSTPHEVQEAGADFLILDEGKLPYPCLSPPYKVVRNPAFSGPRKNQMSQAHQFLDLIC